MSYGEIGSKRGCLGVAFSSFGDVDKVLKILNDLPETYGRAIARLRENNGLTQEDLEEKLSFSLRTLQRIEREESPIPDLDKIMEICIVLELPYDVSMHIFRISGLGDFFFMKNKQSLIYRKILEFEGDFPVDDINDMLIEAGMDPLFSNKTIHKSAS